jgi:diguanylate cyclase (GGDEF)-like protein
MAALAELRGLSAGAPIEPPLRRLDAEAGALNGRHDAADATPLADRLDAIDRETAALVAALRVHGDERAAAARDGGRRSRLTLLAIGGFTLVAGLAAAAMGWSTVNAQRSLVGQLGQLVHEDGLTRVTNRRGLDDRVPIEIARARRIGRPLSAVMIDLDYFKRYNDRRGHAAGDDLLREAAQIWRRQLRPSDLVARYGGEEFTLLLPACDGDQAVQLIDRLRPLMPEAQTFSAGVATWDGFESAPDLLARADRALLQAKRGGRNRTVVAPVEAQMTLPFKVA